MLVQRSRNSKDKDQTKTQSQNNETEVILDCCMKGVYNNETMKCIDQNNNEFPINLPSCDCDSFTEIEEYDSALELCKVNEELYVSCTSEPTIAGSLEPSRLIVLCLCPISVIFLTIILYIYLTILTDLRSQQDIAFMYSIICLILYLLAYIIRYKNGEDSSDDIKNIYHYVGRYFKHAYLAWFQVIIFSRVMMNLNIPSKNTIRPIWYHIYAWTVPLLFFPVEILFKCKFNWYWPKFAMWIINFILIIVALIQVEGHKLEKSRWKNLNEDDKDQPSHQIVNAQADILDTSDNIEENLTELTEMRDLFAAITIFIASVASQEIPDYDELESNKHLNDCCTEPFKLTPNLTWFSCVDSSKSQESALNCINLERLANITTPLNLESTEGCKFRNKENKLEYYGCAKVPKSNQDQNESNDTSNNGLWIGLSVTLVVLVAAVAAYFGRNIIQKRRNGGRTYDAP
uniref:CSON002506 protein n=1 Tax=Culicoides sonorensis TaxID=179676 RepID=A0A336LSI0_CULSO